ncbi:dihydroxyacetone kinase subunit DhaL [Muricomes intestini]|jgi:dihydroxyacetone kinase phosphoprotein-dependent L subunit|uniref:phosphoenolpyruvate--glycerone phosphotransferase n=1 Tax=Muricomes intestini TaxID=1796634 RepID=A0A4R3KD60_9FIRM|nr:dihydroxyacetone kinase subunit DhaL [Muricomes intestini]TCS81097.1 dihydroxyacetone kinase DhaL subunit [Muricomes intestini]
MINSINSGQCKEMILYIADKIIESEPYLTEIDSKIGDGDHGTGMKRGFSAVKKELPAYMPKDPEDVLKETGTILLDSMGGASGVLFGTVFISGITKRRSKGTLNLNDFAEIFRTSLTSLKQRGKASVGDKTMVDAYEPAVIALEKAVQEGKTLVHGFSEAAKAAQDGVQYTKTVKARFGRAKYFGGKAIGLQDAGATSIWIIFRSMSEWISKEKEEAAL